MCRTIIAEQQADAEVDKGRKAVWWVYGRWAKVRIRCRASTVKLRDLRCAVMQDSDIFNDV
jgi:hypothetical protein